MPAEALNPNFYHRSQNTTCWPPHPLSVVGFGFNSATGVFDFSGVPGFNLGRVPYICVIDKKTNKSEYLYCRPIPAPYGLAEVDGEPVPAPPLRGTVIKVKSDTTGMTADDILVIYDP